MTVGVVQAGAGGILRALGPSTEKVHGARRWSYWQLNASTSPVPHGPPQKISWVIEPGAENRWHGGS